jgi:hypothetical protein
MGGMLLAEFAIFFQLNSVGGIFFVFIGPVVAVFTFLTGQRNLNTHDNHLLHC